MEMDELGANRSGGSRVARWRPVRCRSPAPVSHSSKPVPNPSPRPSHPTRPCGGARAGCASLCRVQPTVQRVDDGWNPAAEAELLARLRRGEDAAFETLVREHTSRLLVVTRRLLSSEHDAQDAVQEAFLSAFKAIDSFQGEARLSTWLHRIAVNAALMKRRSQGRRRERDIESLLPQFGEGGHHLEPPTSWVEPSSAPAERTEMRELVRNCIDELPEAYRTVLVLRDIQEMETEEVARHLGVTANAVKIRLHRARQALRALLDPHMHGAGV
jgi:RNA polymerase sigma-70 factor (ECF subfamily)